MLREGLLCQCNTLASFKAVVTAMLHHATKVRISAHSFNALGSMLSYNMKPLVGLRSNVLLLELSTASTLKGKENFGLMPFWRFGVRACSSQNCKSKPAAWEVFDSRAGADRGGNTNAGVIHPGWTEVSTRRTRRRISPFANVKSCISWDFFSEIKALKFLLKKVQNPTP